MMSQKDVEEFAAMIAQMQDDKSFHPKYNKKGDKTLPNKRGPNDLEEQIRVLEFRNAKLHNHNEKIERELLELRDKIKKLEALQTDQFRNKGDM